MTRDRAIAEAVETWFAASARPLPWRTTPRDPWRSFVSEAMLQQTQVARVLEKFEPFMARFPTPRALAEADESEVLAAWSGLGYYRRARNLQRAAREIVEHHGGEVPEDPEALRALTGVGRYTAGAVASIVFGRREPIVDGNVHRVVLRLEGERLVSGSREAERLSWSRAAALVDGASSPAGFNEGLMELGALVCTPRSPSCLVCPVQKRCRAFASDDPESIPLPKQRTARRDLFASTVVVRDSRGRLLVEQRGERGLWARMWQATTVERDDRHASTVELEAELGVTVNDRADVFTHVTTHRDVRFEVWRGTPIPGRRPERGAWRPKRDLESLPLSNPQRSIVLGDDVRGRGTAKGV
ncbi:MAG: A/G-specific adenine glycosylase [Planctomycetota bacterium]